MGAGVLVACLIGAAAVVAAGGVLYKNHHEYELGILFVLAGSVNVILNIYRMWKGLS